MININKSNKFINALCDTGCLFYGIVDSKFVTKCGLKGMKIIFWDVQKFDGLTNGVCNEMVSMRFDIINSHVENSFCYITFKLKYDLILGNPWIEKTVFNIILNPNVYEFGFLEKNRKCFWKKPNKTGLHADTIIRILHKSKKAKIKPNLEMISTNMANIDKILNVKPKIKLKTIVPEHYWGYLNVFDENETNQLPRDRIVKEKGKNQRSSGGRYTICQKPNFWYWRKD